MYILGCCRYLHLSQDAERGVHAFAGFDFWVYPFVVACGVDSSCSLNHWDMRRGKETRPLDSRLLQESCYPSDKHEVNT